MALPLFAAALGVRTAALVRDGRFLLEGAAERPQSAPDRIAARRSAALRKQRLQSPRRGLQTGADSRQNPIPAAVRNRSANPAHPAGADRSGPLVPRGPSRNAQNRYIEQARNLAATPSVGARRNHALAKIIRIGSGHACRPPRQWPTSIMPWKKRESHKTLPIQPKSDTL